MPNPLSTYHAPMYSLNQSNTVSLPSHSSSHVVSVKLYDIKVVDFNMTAEAAKLVILDR